MTDEQMDARLHRAGEAWRVAQTHTQVIEPAQPIDITPRARPHRFSRTGFLFTAAAVAAALAAGLVVVVTGLGGNSHRSADVAGLQNTVWRLVSYDDAQRLTHSLATLVIDSNGQLVADDSCNLVGAHASVTGAQLDVSKIVQRFHPCTDAAGETTFERGVGILRTSPRYAIDGDELTITGGGHAMHLVAAPNLPAPSLDVPTLTGTDWTLTSVKDATGRAVPIKGGARLRIDGDQLLAGDTCNTLSGPVRVDGNAMRVSQLSSTAIGCLGDVANAASVVDAVFAARLEYALTGAALTLTGASGARLEYQWLPSDASATDPTKLADRTWHLWSIAGDPPESDLTLRIDHNGHSAAHLTGDDGCHTIWTWISLNRGSFTVHPVNKDSLDDLNTAAHCDTTVHSLLATGPVVWSIHDGKLLIHGGGAQAFALVYGTRPLPNTATPLAGSTWSEDSSEITTPGQPSGSRGAFEYTDQLRLDGHGGITITHRCYVNQGAVTIGKDTLDITGLTLKSAIPCSATLAQAAEQHADAAADRVLSGRVSWTIDGELHISKDGSTIDFSR
jgi:heat shock protein HslJ